MKNLLSLIAASLISATAGAQNEPPCNCYELSGTISTNTTLSEDCYRLIGCVNVTSGNTVTITAGTTIFADQDASFVVERGAYINAQGTSNNPIVFTTDEAPSSRTRGRWKGLTVAGYAIDNAGGFTLNRDCADITAGGNNDNDSSGVLKYVQIHFAGGQAVGEEEVNGLTLAAVGSKTVIDHIQITESATDGIALIGGKVNARYIVTYNIEGNDITTNLGYRGMVQFGLSLRLDANAHVASGSNAILSRNDYTGSSNTPKTKPIFSNISILGPAYCGGSGLSADFRNGVLFKSNTEARIYNSLIAGWPNGFRIEDLATIQNANDNATLFFATNSFYSLASNFSHSGSWTGTGCELSMSDWINFGNVSGNLCAMTDNETFSSGLGYHSSICTTYCTSTPVFTMTSTSMSGPDFSWSDLGNAFFSSVGYRGALTGTDLTAGWTDWCTQRDYCPDDFLRPQQTERLGREGVKLSPNPAGSTTTATFYSTATGTATAVISDPATGRSLSLQSLKIAEKGTQSVQLSLSGLRKGTYLLTLTMPDGKKAATQLSVE